MLLSQGRVWGLSSPLVAIPPPRFLHIPELAPACPCRGQQERGPEPDTPLRRPSSTISLFLLPQQQQQQLFAFQGCGCCLRLFQNFPGPK